MAKLLRLTLVAAGILILAGPAQGQRVQSEVYLELERHPADIQHPGMAMPKLDARKSRLLNGRSNRSELTRTYPYASSELAIWLLIEQIDQFWDAAAGGGAGDWMNNGRVRYTRNSAGAATELLIESWDDATSDWVPTTRVIYEQDAQGYLTATVYENWNQNANGGEGAWEPIQRYGYTNDSQGKTLVSTYEIWDEDAGEYFLYSRISSTYSGGRLVQQVSEGLDFLTGMFGPRLRYTFEYDSAGNTTQRLIESYDGMTEEWENWSLRHWTYDSNGGEVEDLERSWDPTANGGLGDWVNTHRTVTAYTPDSSDPTEIVETDQQWDPDADGGQGAWVNVDRWVTVLDFSGGTYTLTDTYQRWDPDANGGLGDWVNDQQDIVTLTSDFDVIEVIHQVWDPDLPGKQGAWVNESRNAVAYNAQGLPVESLQQGWDGAQWVNQFRLLQVFEEFAATAVEGESPEGRYALEANYPNPFRESTSIRFTLPAADDVTLEVYDLLGRRVMTIIDGLTPPGTHVVTLKAAGLAGGVYVYSLKGDHFSASRTMLLVR